MTQPYGAPSTTVNSVIAGILNVTSQTNDPMIDMAGLGSFDPNIFRYVNIRYRVLSGTPGTAEIFFYNGRTILRWAANRLPEFWSEAERGNC
ncbi:MAG: hypothetical protein IPN95_27775 [Bacteroidetes bacterium]|nr:hypothetical protein [Bacteroidota bacterium]